MIADLSVKGCRVKGKTIVTPGDFGKLLIYVPTGITPLTVSLTSVRWVSGHECGLEFILMDIDEQGCLNRFLNHAKSQLEPVVAVVPDHWGETKQIPSRPLHTMLGPTGAPKMLLATAQKPPVRSLPKQIVEAGFTAEPMKDCSFHSEDLESLALTNSGKFALLETSRPLFLP